MKSKPFKQVDVFCSTAYSGNPVAVVFDADDLDDASMQAIARWTNLSETAFLQTPTDRNADYRIRIFTPSAELPFAGHPSVGTAFAAIEAGTVDGNATRIVQECGAGLIRLFVEGQGEHRKVFVTSPVPEIDPLPASEEDVLASVLQPFACEYGEALIVDVGARWVTVELSSEDALRNGTPDFEAISALSDRFSLSGLTAFALADNEAFQVAVRSFAPAHGIAEDPVCGSGNVSVAAHLNHVGRLDVVGPSYTASQGREIGRDGLVSVRVADDGREISVGGRARICVSGSLSS